MEALFDGPIRMTAFIYLEFPLHNFYGTIANRVPRSYIVANIDPPCPNGQKNDIATLENVT
jgi:hypothetical protein